MRRRAATWCALVVGFTLIFAGVATAKPMSAKVFRKTANSICAQANQLYDETAAQYFTEGEEPDLAALEGYAAAVEPIVEQQIDGIAALEPPKKLKKKVKKLIATSRAELEAFLDDPSTALESDPFEETKRLSDKLGLPDCAS